MNRSIFFLNKERTVSKKKEFFCKRGDKKFMIGKRKKLSWGTVNRVTFITFFFWAKRI